MNYNFEEIINTLLEKNGEEETAKFLSDALNSAIESKKAKDAEAEKKAAEEARLHKIAATRELLNALANYLAQFYPELDCTPDIFDELSDEELGGFIDEIDTEFKQYLKLMNIFPKKAQNKLKASIDPARSFNFTIKTPNSTEDIFRQFFIDNNI